MTDEPTPDDKDELLETIQNVDVAWDVSDWEYESGRYDESTMLVEVTWSPPEPAALEMGEIQNLKTLIAKIESEHEDGAPLNTVLKAANDEFGWDVPHVSDEIDALRTKGEVYEPKPDHLRTT
jgi:DNA replicative helicase MCM subunit Mcm2 (Cdc46/Mcm family)